MGGDRPKAAADEFKLPATPPKADNLLTHAGLVLTIVWLLVLLVYWLSNRPAFWELKPNEMGDFFAGAFAPLAFLWLVLGFFQQGKELRHSGEALWLQGRELQHSVEQQRELVNVTREQLQFESAVLRAQQEELVRNAQPILKLQPGGNAGDVGGGRRYDFYLVNHGKKCTGVRVMIGDRLALHHDVLESGGRAMFVQRMPDEGQDEFVVDVTYLDERLVQGTKTFTVLRDRARFVVVDGTRESS